MFEHDRKFLELNPKQRLSYVIMAVHMMLRTKGHVNVFGAAGTGKSEAVMKLYNDYVNEVLVSTPTGLLASKYAANTYFSNLSIPWKINMKSGVQLNHDARNKMRYKHRKKLLNVVDEIFSIGQYKAAMLRERQTELFQYTNELQHTKEGSSVYVGCYNQQHPIGDTTLK